MKEGFILTRREASELFILLSNARLKLTGKFKTSAQKWWEKFEEAMGLSLAHNKPYVQDLNRGTSKK